MKTHHDHVHDRSNDIEASDKPNEDVANSGKDDEGNAKLSLRIHENTGSTHNKDRPEKVGTDKSLINTDESEEVRKKSKDVGTILPVSVVKEIRAPG